MLRTNHIARTYMYISRCRRYRRSTVCHILTYTKIGTFFCGKSHTHTTSVPGGTWDDRTWLRRGLNLIRNNTYDTVTLCFEVIVGMCSFDLSTSPWLDLQPLQRAVEEFKAMEKVGQLSHAPWNDFYGSMMFSFLCFHDRRAEKLRWKHC